MKKEKLDLSLWKNIKLSFKQSQYQFMQVLTAAYTGPAIRLEIKDITVPGEDVFKLDSLTMTQRAAGLTPVFLKYEGKFQLIAGLDHLKEALDKKELVLEGNLLSSHAFKNCKVQPVIAAPAAIETRAIPTKPWPPRPSAPPYRNTRS